MFDIQLSKRTTGRGTFEGKIFLGGHYEKFFSSSSYQSREQYREQWRNALWQAVEDREVAAIISDFAVNKKGLGVLWTYPLIPVEQSHGAAPEEVLASGIFVTQRFFHITIDPENFVRKTGRGVGAGVPLYYFDPDDPTRIFSYIDTCIAGYSHWFFEDRSVMSFLEGSPQ
jgi:hypothetical protein